MVNLKTKRNYKHKTFIYLKTMKTNVYNKTETDSQI